MEEAFENLKKESKNNVDNLVKWMKDANVIEDTQKAETEARTLFSDAKDQKSVEFEKFTEVVTKTATEQTKNVEDFFKSLGDKGADIQSAVTDAVSGAVDAATDKASEAADKASDAADKASDAAEDLKK